MDENNIFPLFREGKRECLPMTRSQSVIFKDNKNNDVFFREQESFVLKKIIKTPLLLTFIQYNRDESVWTWGTSPSHCQNSS